MPRRPRAFHPGDLTHVTARGIDDQPIFHSDLDREDLLAILRTATALLEVEVIAWCLMTTHYHVLLAVPAEPETISRLLHRVQSSYARRFNSWHGRRGHVFGARFTDTPTRSAAHARRTIAYLLDNPVRAGIVKRSDEWNWSGLDTLRPRDELGTLASPNRRTPVRRAG
ncbi:MAG TPA: transposase [Gaiellaceae bacterium]|nr:transposase [Gaiellaceae bacterium]